MNPCAPRFLLPLSGTVEVTEGESFVLEVRVHGHPPPEVEWFKNGQELSSGYSTSSQGKLEMRINNVTQNHTGEYRCTAVNQSGRVSSAMWLAVVPKHYPRYWFRDTVFTQIYRPMPLRNIVLPYVDNVREMCFLVASDGNI